MKHLLRRISNVGYKEKYVRRVALPDWWEDCIALNPAGLQQALILLSLNLCLDPRSLQEESGLVRFREFSNPKYKLKLQDTPESVRAATCIAFRAAELICQSVWVKYTELPSSAADIRSSILDSGALCIGLEELLDYCWGSGIPVLHISDFPIGAHKPDALAVIVNGRPAIALCKHTEYSSWLLFHLAHELGHIILGHLKGANILIDEEVKGDTDIEETEANQFAVELLTGFKQRIYNFGARAWKTQVAMNALVEGRDTNVDPGFIALSHGRMTRNWGAAQGALQIIERKPAALTKVRERIRIYLDPELLSRDSDEFLMRITAVDTLV